MRLILLFALLVGLPAEAKGPATDSGCAPKWRPRGIIFKNHTITPADNYSWYQLQALAPTTVTLPDPDSNSQARGMAIVVEQADELYSFPTLIVVQGNRPIRLPDGSETISWEVPHSTGKANVHIFRLTAGNQFATYAWYVSVGP